MQNYSLYFMFLPIWKGKIVVCPTVWTCNSAFRWCCWSNEWLRRYFSHSMYLSWNDKFLLMFSKKVILTLLISLFNGLIRQHYRFDQKLCLWSFSVTEVGVSASFSIRSITLIFVAMCFVSRWIDPCNFGGGFLYVLVTFLS